MEFKKFSSIENTYRDTFFDQIREEGKDGGQWVVMEKVHGAQFSIYYDGTSIQASSRTAFLTDEIDFFNWQNVLHDNREKMTKLYEMLKQTEHVFSQVIVYGEIFGGSYPHPDVDKVKTAKRLQKGVHYHPDNLFYAFDIRVDRQYLPVDETDSLFEKAGFFYAKALFRGALEECIKHPDDFVSRISQWLGLPPIADNIAEGIVIKPVEPRFLNVGDRVILKSKNEKFIERKSRKKRPVKKDSPLSEAARKLQQELESLVTENRLQNILSKKGELPDPLPGDYFGQIMQDFSADIWEEFNKDFETPYINLEKKEQKRVSKALNQAAAKIVKKALLS